MEERKRKIIKTGKIRIAVGLQLEFPHIFSRVCFS